MGYWKGMEQASMRAKEKEKELEEERARSRSQSPGGAPATETPDEESIEDTFTFFDANGDGTISFEVCIWRLSFCVHFNPGYSLQEMEYVVLLLGGDHSRDNLDKLWDLVDTDEDASRISFQEFSTAWKNPDIRDLFHKPGSEGTSWPHTDVGFVYPICSAITLTNCALVQ